ncbi:MAG: right-handed parallel beta-helix repeat-containing protein, partial [Acidobacteria bacterium]|nr:right-handed parallel beta-helix repeat-containing protein [Acidobacteriota bacterium]
ISTSRNGAAWTAPQAVDAGNGAPAGTPGGDMPGHQLMPSMSFAAGKLVVVYYDLREDVSRVFGPFISENDAVNTVRRRHTIDIRAAYALKGDLPVFGPSQQVSSYLQGNLRGSTEVGPLQVNAPALPLFKLGTVPFLGDYIDIAPSPAFVRNARGVWGYNTTAQAAPVFHVVWTDNRDVQKPADGDWTNYTPVGTATDAGKYADAPACVPGQAGMRNQNIYSARLTWGLVAGSPGNTKPLDATTPRSFVVFAQNTTTTTKTFRFSIASQPVGGVASFTQARTAAAAYPMTSVDVSVAPRSMVTRTVFVTSTDAKAQVPVDVQQVSAPSAPVISGGLASRVLLNPDISNPDISNPDISNPDISNPDISNAEVYNPDISNPDISNPDISNPDISNPDISNPDISNIVIANPDISNPDISNPDISNPDISNPDISNPDISNPDISNGAITDVTWTIINTGNTTASFNVNLFLANAAAKLAGPGGTGVNGGIKTQLVVHKTYATPVAIGCDLKQQSHTVLVANVPYPTFYEPGTNAAFDPANADVTNTTLWLEPGGEGKITLRIVDPNPNDGIAIDPVHDVTPVVTAEPKNTPDLGAPAVPPPSTTPPVAPSVTLAFTAQPTNTLVNGVIAPISVHAQVGANPGANVQVTLAIAINPAGGHLNGTTTVLTDAAGNATFAGLSIEKAGIGYRLSASAAASGAVPDLSAPFTIGAIAPPPPPATVWSASGSGTVTLLDNGFAGGTPRMSYQDNVFGVFNGAWTLTNAATSAGTVRLDWEWTGLHSYCLAAAQLQAFVNRGGTDVFTASLVNVADGCSAAENPSAGFAFAGVTPVNVQAGDTYGFRLNGSRFDGSYLLEGTFGVVVNGLTSPSPFVVTNASDSGAGSLRNALTAANALPDLDTITFAIPGAWVHTIAPQTALPLVTQPVIIDGLSQPGAASMAPMINISGRFMKQSLGTTADDAPGTIIGSAAGFEVASSDVTIRGLGINGFPGPGVFINNSTNNVHVEDNAIGAGLAGVATWPSNGHGVWANYSTNHVITRNVISSSDLSGVLLVGGSGTSITSNRIGTTLNGLGVLANNDNGITIYDGASGTVIDGNLISGNGNGAGPNGWGIDLQQSGGLASVANTTITNNVIGLDVNGNILSRVSGPLLGNAGGGIRITRAYSTIVGGVGGGNVISGNTGSGIRVEGPNGGFITSIVGNKIGSDLLGTSSRGNGGTGVSVDTNASRVTMQSNVIFGNGGLGISLESAANGSQAAPSLSVQAAQSLAGHTVVDVTLTGAPGAYPVEFFAGASCGAAQQLVGSTVGSIGPQTVELGVGLAVGTWITATATDGFGNTSQLAACTQVPPAVPSAIITSVSPGNGAPGEGFLVVRGTNLPAGAGDSFATVVTGATTQNGFVFQSATIPTAVFVRLPFGQPLGASTIQIKNATGTIVSNAFPLTITATPGTPVITGILDPGLNPVSGPQAAGNAIYVQADGIDTMGTVVRFTQGANTWDVSGVGVSNSSIGFALQVTVPVGATSGPINVSIRQGASAFSAAVVITIL